MKVVIVESPAKAKTINKYLGKDYDVYASFGHVRDLEAKDGSVDPDNDFAMRWEVDGKAAKRLTDIGGAVKTADRVILATDPDREGEAISWHIYEILKNKKLLKDKRVDRVVFNAVTKEAVQEAMRNPREIDQALVDAYLARRALDYLVGFNLSPVLWRKLPGARSAGRVQSVALRIVCDRELEIEKFVAREYWSILAHLQDPGERGLHRAAGRRGRQEDRPARRRLRRRGARFRGGAGERRASRSPRSRPSRSSAIRSRRSPPRPCSRRRRASSASRRRAPCRSRSGSMRASTSARGRSASLPICAPTASISRPRRSTAARDDDRQASSATTTCPRAPRKYTAKAKNAQEAHEAIRPTDVTRRPKDIAAPSGAANRRKLYELIWNRTDRLPDGERRARAHHGRDSRRRRRAQARFPRHRPGRALRRLPRALPGGARRRGGRGFRAAAGDDRRAIR